MRLTWLVLGAVVAAGAVAFINTDRDPPPLQETRPASPPAKEDGPAAPSVDLTRSDADVAAEKRARAALEQLAGVRAQGASTEALESRLRTDAGAWDAPSARRYAYVEGRRVLAEAGEGRGKSTIEQKDRARRLLSRALYLPEMFDPAGQPSPERTKLIATIEQLNRQVMTYGPGIPGVTVPYKVPAGEVPVEIVSRQRLPMGPNALLFWNMGGNLDPRRVRADATMLLPQEEMTLHVSLKHRRLAIFFGDWFAKEWRVGIGAEDSPTPTGIFEIYSKDLNPDWYAPGGKVIKWEDKEHNELGDAWMGIRNQEYPREASFGLHGTNKPDTVGTRCSRGCVRLRNEHAVELRDWVRREGAGGPATRVLIY
ncbi:MAG: L,D-transpeptidase [Planctomycetota bacterium]|nr:L,D-transpeptidase [Planctomycetota bacterium]